MAGVTSTTGQMTLSAGVDVRGSRLVASVASVDANVLLGQVNTNSIVTFISCLGGGTSTVSDGCNNGTVIYRQSSTDPTQAPALPLLAPVQPGTTDVTVTESGTTVLAPGSYGAVTVLQGGTLTLAGGDYQVASVALVAGGRILVEQPSALRIAGSLSTGANCVIGPDPTLDLALNLRIEVLGQDTTPTAPSPGTGGSLGVVAAGDAGEGTPTLIPAVSLGSGNSVGAVIVAPNGTIQVGDSGFVIGGLTAVTVNLGMNSGLMSGTTPDRLLRPVPINRVNGCIWFKCPMTPCSGSRFIPVAGGYPYENPGELVGCPGISTCEGYAVGSCGLPNGRGVCQEDGSCSLLSCNASYTNCGGGVCDNLATDSNNCGSCGNVCNGSESCGAPPSNGAICSAVDHENQQTTASVLLGGYAATTAPVTFSAMNWTTPGPEPIVGYSATPSGSSPASWTTSPSLPLALLDYWAPQSVTVSGAPYQLNGLATSIGHAEITVSQGGTNFTVVDDANTPSCAAVSSQPAACTDPSPFVATYNYGVGSQPPTVNDWTAWQTDQTGTAAPVGVAWDPTKVQWEVGHYMVQQRKIQGILCHPTATPPVAGYRGMIINHSGFNVDDFALGLCLDYAADNWVVAMSAYRGEAICNLDAAGDTCGSQLTGVMGPPAGPGTFPCGPAGPNSTGACFLSEGNVELCLGEVIDSLQLTTMLGTYRPPGSTSTWVDPTKLLMWGHSHGACVTLRAVEAGAPVAAAAAFDGPTDLAAWSNYCDPCLNAQGASNACDVYAQGNVAAGNAAALGAAPGNGSFQCEEPGDPVAGLFPCMPTNDPVLYNPTDPFHTPLYCVYPGAPGGGAPPAAPGLSVSRVPYDWRSPVTYAPDLAARNDVKVLVVQGNADPLIEPSQACELAIKAGSFQDFHVKTWGPCYTTTDCLSGTCNYSTGGGCKPPLEACAVGSDCCSGSCTNGLCSFGQCVCNAPSDCLGLGATCSAPAPGAALVCTCANSSQCGGGTCVGGVCVAGFSESPLGADGLLANLVGCGPTSNFYIANANWVPGKLPTDFNPASTGWPLNRYLVVVDGADHSSILDLNSGGAIFTNWMQSIFGP
jgi:hypothetical protein